MNNNKKRSLIIYLIPLTFFIIFIIISCPNIPDNDDTNNESIYTNNKFEPKGDRLLGIEVSTASDDDYIHAYNKADELGINFVHFSIGWNNLDTTTDTSPNDYVLIDPNNYIQTLDAFYSMNNKDVYLTILGPLNTCVRNMPADLINRELDDPDVINRFKVMLDFLLPLLNNVDLTGLIIGNEVDIYLKSHPGEINNFKNFFIAVKNHVKTINPDLLVSFTTTLIGAAVNLKDDLLLLNQNSDFISLTYYPLNPDFTVQSPGVVKNDIKQICDIYDKDIYFQECGYQTSEECLSSEKLQSDFIKEVFLSWDTYKNKIKAISFYQLTDWKPEYITAYLNEQNLGNNTKLFEYIRTIGLRTYPDTGTDKMGYLTLKKEASIRGW